MKQSSTQLKAAARGHLSGRYTVLIIACMLANIIIDIPSMVISYTVNPHTVSGSLINAAVTFILSALSTIFIVGQNYICLSYGRSEDQIPTSYMWYGFKGRADDIIIAYFLIFIRLFVYALPFSFALVFYTMAANIYTFLLLVAAVSFSAVMCIRVELDYSQVFFLLIDHPQMRPKELLSQSKQIMRGSRGRLFYIQLSFIGMYLLNLLTFGMAAFWTAPYIRMTLTELYLELTGTVSSEPEAHDEIA